MASLHGVRIPLARIHPRTRRGGLPQAQQCLVRQLGPTSQFAQQLAFEQAFGQRKPQRTGVGEHARASFRTAQVAALGGAVHQLA
jgi:hypothetical protein